MGPKHCLTVLHVSILAALLLTLDADGEESGCIVELRVRRGTVYEADLGEDLRINCTVVFCSSSPPTVTWYKRDRADVPVNVNSSSHIKMEWKRLKHSEGRSMLVFQNVLSTDAGLYCCKSGESVSHNNNVSVRGEVETKLNVPARGEVESKVNVSAHEIPHDTFWPCVYRAVGFTVFVIVILTICVATKCRRKGKRRDTPDLSRHTCRDASPTIHINENDRPTNRP